MLWEFRNESYPGVGKGTAYGQAPEHGLASGRDAVPTHYTSTAALELAGHELAAAVLKEVTGSGDRQLGKTWYLDAF